MCGRDWSSDVCSSDLVSYWMNKLQNIDKAYPLFITLNPPKAPDPEKVFQIGRASCRERV